jgi:hypothetical protein
MPGMKTRERYVAEGRCRRCGGPRGRWKACFGCRKEDGERKKRDAETRRRGGGERVRDEDLRQEGVIYQSFSSGGLRYE